MFCFRVLAGVVRVLSCGERGHVGERWLRELDLGSWSCVVNAMMDSLCAQCSLIVVSMCADGEGAQVAREDSHADQDLFERMCDRTVVTKSCSAWFVFWMHEDVRFLRMNARRTVFMMKDTMRVVVRRLVVVAGRSVRRCSKSTMVMKERSLLLMRRKSFVMNAQRCVRVRERAYDVARRLIVVDGWSARWCFDDVRVFGMCCGHAV